MDSLQFLHPLVMELIAVACFIFCRCIFNTGFRRFLFPLPIITTALFMLRTNLYIVVIQNTREI